MSLCTFGPGWAALIILGVLGLAAFAFFLFMARQSQQKEPSQIPWYYPGVMMEPAGLVEDRMFSRRLADALKQAETFLIGNTLWRADEVALACQTLYVKITAYPLPYERAKGVVQVKRSLEGLCHELAHHCELEIRGAVDERHETWHTNGLWAASEAYEEWLIAPERSKARVRRWRK